MSPTRTRKTSETATNTLIVAQLPIECFDPIWLDAIRAVFARHGEIHTWAPLRFLRRAIITFWSPEDAERAKRQLDGLVLPSSPPAKIRVYRGANTAIRTTSAGSPTDPSNPDPYYLAPPRLEKNFLISPPGSPPIGWEPIVEDPPNAAPLAADLIAALTRLQLSQDGGAGEAGGKKRKGSTEIVYEATAATDGVSIVVSVEDFGDSPDASDAEEPAPDWARGSTPIPRTRFVPTALPPMVR